MQLILVFCCQLIYFLLSFVFDILGYLFELIVDMIINYCLKCCLVVLVVCIFDLFDYVDKFIEIYIFRLGYFIYYYFYFKVVR